MAERVRDIIEGVVAEREGPYYDAIRAARRRPDGGLAALQKEILGEMAAALGRAAEHVENALSALGRLDAELTALEQDATKHDAIEQRYAAYSAAYELAERRLWELMVHREALGIRNHDALAETYPMPHRRAPPRAAVTSR